MATALFTAQVFFQQQLKVMVEWVSNPLGVA